MLILLIVEIYKLRNWVNVHWRNIYASFCHNHSSILAVSMGESQIHTLAAW
jgi:hypothetical protein